MAILIKPISFPLAIWPPLKLNVLDIFHSPIQFPSLPSLCPRKLASVDYIKGLLPLWLTLCLFGPCGALAGVWRVGRDGHQGIYLPCFFPAGSLISSFLPIWRPSIYRSSMPFVCVCFLKYSLFLTLKTRVLRVPHCYKAQGNTPSLVPFHKTCPAGFNYPA